MNATRVKHEKAMELADIALIHQMQGNEDEAKEYFRRAFRLEEEAASIYKDKTEAEPTRSVLYRSAASLAVDANDYREAERLAATGLAGYPPAEIANELRAILEKVNFFRHLEIKGMTLSSNDLQISIAGKETTVGIAPSDIVIEKMESMEKTIHRTGERLGGKKYRTGGISPLVAKLRVYMAVPTANSFAITIKIGHPDQSVLPGMEDMDSPSQVVQELLDCIELLNSGDESRLRNRILDPAYFNNFVSLMNKVAPDGDQITGVGFTSIQYGTERKVQLLRQQNDIAEIPLIKVYESNTQSIKKERIQGRLLYADALKDIEQGIIKLLAENGKHIRVVVPQGMDDIVGSLWNQNVEVTGSFQGRRFYLDHIEKSQ